MGLWNIILLALAFLFVSCSGDGSISEDSFVEGSDGVVSDEAGEPSLEKALFILSSFQDFVDFSNDFKERNGVAFDPVLLEMKELTPEFKQERIVKLEASPATSAYTLVYEGLPDKPLVFVVQLQDASLKERGVITVIDFSTEEVLKFYATISLVK